MSLRVIPQSAKLYREACTEFNEVQILRKWKWIQRVYISIHPESLRSRDTRYDSLSFDTSRIAWLSGHSI